VGENKNVDELDAYFPSDKRKTEQTMPRPMCHKKGLHVILFQRTYMNDLEAEINNWLDANPGITPINISLSNLMDYPGDIWMTVAAILYEG